MTEQDTALAARLEHAYQELREKFDTRTLPVVEPDDMLVRHLGLFRQAAERLRGLTAPRPQEDALLVTDEQLLKVAADAMWAWTHCRICEGENSDAHDSLPHGYEGATDAEIASAMRSTLGLLAAAPRQDETHQRGQRETPPFTREQVDGALEWVQTELRVSAHRHTAEEIEIFLQPARTILRYVAATLPATIPETETP